LEVAAHGLLLMSESDRPLKYFSLPRSEEIMGVGEGEELSPHGFLALLGVSTAFTDDHEVPIDELIQEETLDDFLERVYLEGSESASESNTPSKPVQKLKTVLEHGLRGVKVLRVGTVDVRCYVAGIDERGDIAGLVTTAIET
jgi:hypothetical protein